MILGFVLFLCYCRKQGLRINLRIRRYDYLYGIELPKQLAGFQGAAPIGGVEGQCPRNQRISLFRKPSPESSPGEKTEQNQKSWTNPPERFGQSARADFVRAEILSIRAGTSREQQFLEIK